MSYIDQDRKYGRSSIAAVALLHLGIGYAVYSGLAYTVIPFVDRPIIAQIFKDPPPPPPHDLPPPRSTPQPRTVTAEPKLVDMTPRLDATGSFPLQSPVTPPICPLPGRRRSRAR